MVCGVVWSWAGRDQGAFSHFSFGGELLTQEKPTSLPKLAALRQILGKDAKL